MKRRLRRAQELLAAALLVLTAGSAAGLGRIAERGAAEPESASRPPVAVHPAEDPAASPPAPPVPSTSAPAPTSTSISTPAATVEPPAPVRQAAAAAPSGSAASRIPLGKGMWLHQLSHAGSATAVVNHAGAVGLTHLYLRVGSSRMGFYGQEELDLLLPVAHAAGLKVVGWDFPYLFDPAEDAERAAAAIAYVTPDGHRIDAFSADIETEAEGVNLTAEGALAYGARLRSLVGPDYPLIATVPRPSPRQWFPLAEATAHFDAIAPMVYWMNRDPAGDVAGALADLASFGKPVLPIGQAYDGGPEGGPPGPPPRDHLDRFMDTALANGALGVSFWVWHHATPEHWAAIREATAWELHPGDPHDGRRVIYLQRVLAHLGQPIVEDGILGPQTRSALAAVQESLGLPGTGSLDRQTVNSLLGPPLPSSGR